LSSAFAAEPKSEGDNEIDAEIDLDTLVQSAHPAA